MAGGAHEPAKNLAAAAAARTALKKSASTTGLFLIRRGLRIFDGFAQRYIGAAEIVRIGAASCKHCPAVEESQRERRPDAYRQQKATADIRGVRTFRSRRKR